MADVCRTISNVGRHPASKPSGQKVRQLIVPTCGQSSKHVRKRPATWSSVNNRHVAPVCLNVCLRTCFTGSFSKSAFGLRFSLKAALPRPRFYGQPRGMHIIPEGRRRGSSTQIMSGRLAAAGGCGGNGFGHNDGLYRSTTKFSALAATRPAFGSASHCVPMPRVATIRLDRKRLGSIHEASRKQKPRSLAPGFSALDVCRQSLLARCWTIMKVSKLYSATCAHR